MDSLNGLLAATSLLENGLNILVTALGLGLVIFFHELGHFAVAKWCGVYVERFSIGFGPVVFGWKWGETEYVLSALPFGGYVKMLGQDDSDPSQLTNEELAADPRSYSAKPVWQRMAIISAGVTMNLITAVMFFAVAFLNGVRVSPPIIGEVIPGMPAWAAGLEAGDRVDGINGRPVTTFADISLNTALSDDKVHLEGVRRDNKTRFDVTLDPFTSQTRKDITRPQIGLGPTAGLEIENYPKRQLPPAVAGTKFAAADPPFRNGDKIVEFNGAPVATYAEFVDKYLGRSGDKIQFTVDRKIDAEGKPMPTERVTIRVEPDYVRTLGLRMDCGKIAAIQQGSPAEQAGLKADDKLLQVNGLNVGTDIDPMKLPNEFTNWAGQEIPVKVKRQKEGSGTEDVTVVVTPRNKPGWSETPNSPGEPLPIPALGLAFHMIPKVVSVEPGSAAAEAGIKPEARITSVTLALPRNPDADKKASALSQMFKTIYGLFGWNTEPQETITVSLSDPKDDRKENNWPYAFWLMQELPQETVTLSVLEDQKTTMIKVSPQLDKEWLTPNIGLRFSGQVEIKKANGIGEAVSMAVDHTRSSCLNIYLTLRSLITRRLSYKELHGPIGIASAAFYVASEGIVPLLLFLGFLSVNLAVLNFLPIPVLDGGHMVFLLWEGVTRRKPSEQVVAGATYAGMLLLLGLMVLVLYLDLFEHRLGFG